jgi:hypothetical protein
MFIIIPKIWFCKIGFQLDDVVPLHKLFHSCRHQLHQAMCSINDVVICSLMMHLQLAITFNIKLN